MITPAEFEDRMKYLAKDGYPEERHIEADRLICEVLRDLGYEAGVKIFETMEIWVS